MGLRSFIKQKNRLIKSLIMLVRSLRQELKESKLKNADYEDRLAKYENPKNSSNSSVPPSKDENRPKRTQSQRKKSHRKPGGQKGHKGSKLNMVSHGCTPKMWKC